MIEDPKNGKAILNETTNGIEIIIPTTKYWFIIIFMGFWLCGWLAAEISLPVLLFGAINEIGLWIIFIIVWYSLWTFGGIYMFRIFLWNIRGEEVITIKQNELIIEQRGTYLTEPKIYDLKEVRSFHVEEISKGWDIFYNNRRGYLSLTQQAGTLWFKYGLKTVKMAAGIDEAEAEFILSKLLEKKLLQEDNIEPRVLPHTRPKGIFIKRESHNNNKVAYGILIVCGLILIVVFGLFVTRMHLNESRKKNRELNKITKDMQVLYYDAKQSDDKESMCRYADIIRSFYLLDNDSDSYKKWTQIWKKDAEAAGLNIDSLENNEVESGDQSH